MCVKFNSFVLRTKQLVCSCTIIFSHVCIHKLCFTYRCIFPIGQDLISNKYTYYILKLLLKFLSYWIKEKSVNFRFLSTFPILLLLVAKNAPLDEMHCVWLLFMQNWLMRTLLTLSPFNLVKRPPLKPLTNFEYSGAV